MAKDAEKTAKRSMLGDLPLKIQALRSAIDDIEDIVKGEAMDEGEQGDDDAVQRPAEVEDPGHKDGEMPDTKAAGKKAMVIAILKKKRENAAG